MRKVIALLSLVVFAFAAPVANAALVTDWHVGVVANFDTTTVVWSGPPPGTANPLSLRWGTSTGSGQSGLDITNPVGATNVLTGNLIPVPNVSLTDHNNPITGSSLSSVVLDATLTLTPFVPSLPGLLPVTQTFQINYLETPNADNPCANGIANGVGININGCADIFAIDQSALNFPFVYDTDGILGPDPALTYFISFFEITNGLNPLPNAASIAVVGHTGALGFMTAENADTTATFGAIITAIPVQIDVPEPSTFLLLGAGLAGLGFLRRRMKK